MDLSPATDPYSLQGKGDTCLLLHGFGGSPFEMSYLAERLHEQSWNVVVPLLPGHGKSPEALAEVCWTDWLDAALAAFDDLPSQGRRITVIGQSLGALLAAHLCALRSETIEAAAWLATPLKLPPLSLALIRAWRSSPWKGWSPRLPRRGGVDIREPKLRHGLPAYKEIPIQAAAQLVELSQATRRLLPKIDTPLLVCHGREDHTASRSSAKLAINSVASERKQMLMLPRSYHVISLDVDRTVLADTILEFFRDELSGAAD